MPEDQMASYVLSLVFSAVILLNQS